MLSTSYVCCHAAQGAKACRGVVVSRVFTDDTASVNAFYKTFLTR
jgi:hypothetical protein